MQTIEQIMQMVEREKDSIHTFVEHMGIILNNTTDPLTKELLAHLVEEEEEHFARIQELLPALQVYAEGAGGSGVSDQGVQSAASSLAHPVVATDGRAQNGVHRRLSVGSLIQY
jgi:hypothetical protein